jgi:excinuclease ABC subunit A
MCEICQGTGYVPEAWDVRLHGLSLPEINALTLEEVHTLFGDEESLARPLTLACGVGLGYLVWHQPAYTLSGGEVQRLKIVKELARRNRRRKTEETLYILDEPTVGQHMEDVVQLVEVLHRLVDGGNTVVLIEHHPHVLAACDWLVELGPGGGPDGGRVIASGTPESVGKAGTPTAPYLRDVLQPEVQVRR